MIGSMSMMPPDEERMSTPRTIGRRVLSTHPDHRGSTWTTAVAVICLLLAGCAATVTPSALPNVIVTPAPSVQASPEVLTFTGGVSEDTSPFQLSADTYRSTWTKAAGCAFYASLESPTDDTLGGTAGSSLSDGPTSGETWMYGIGGPGAFYLHVFGNCRWSVTLTAG